MIPPPDAFMEGPLRWVDVAIRMSLTQGYQTEIKSAHPGEENQVRGLDWGLQAEKTIGATDATGLLIFLVKWHLYKKYEFSCGVSGSNNFFRLETPIETSDPIFLPRVSRFYLEAEKQIIKN